MDKDSILDALGNGSPEFEALKQSPELLEGFMALIESVDKLTDMDRRIQEKGLSLYQAISKGKDIHVLEGILEKFFGKPVKPAGEPVSGELQRTQTYKHFKKIKKEQSLFIQMTGETELYGALLPWSEKEGVITVHLGLCSAKMPYEDYQKIEQWMSRRMAKRVSKQVDSSLGGQVQGISLTSFLQMSEMEGSTCTLRIRSGSKNGVLYLEDGQLVDAEAGDLKHLEAAYEIIGWEGVTIEIEKTVGLAERNVNVPLMQVLMESLKQKDDREYAKTASPSRAKSAETSPPARVSEGVGGGASGPEERAAIGQAKMAELENIVPIEIQSKEASAPAEKTRQKSEVNSDQQDQLIDLELMDTEERERRLFEKAQERKKLAQLAVKHGRLKKKTLMAAVVAAAVLGAGAFLGWSVFLKEPRQSAYEKLQVALSQAVDWEVKEKLVMDFIDTQPPGEERAMAETTLQKIWVEAEEANYKKTIDGVFNMPMDASYEKKATDLYAQFLKRYPASRYRGDIEKALARISELSDDFDFSQLRNIDVNEYISRLQACEAYLSKHPQGAHRNAVKAMMRETINASYYDFTKRIQQCEKAKAWGKCIQICDEYSAKFQSYLAVDTIKATRDKMQSKKDYDALIAGVVNVDDAAARKRYVAYLAKYPEAEERKEIEAALDRINRKGQAAKRWDALKAEIMGTARDPGEKMDLLQDYIFENSSGPYVQEARSLLRQLETENEKLSQERYQAARKKLAEAQAQKEAQEKQAASLKLQKEQERIKRRQQEVIAMLQKSNRFVVTQPDVVIDRKTSLMWSLLDSNLVQGDCMNFRSAVQYVRGLRHGGYSDWRLPTSGELAGIYKNSPYFPPSGAEWYWTSESFAKGYHEEANIVTSKPESGFSRTSVSTDACGTVRAVRP